MQVRALAIAFVVAAGCDANEAAPDCDIELPALARLGNAPAVPAEQVIGTPCATGPIRALDEGTRRVSFDRATRWRDVVTALGEVEPDERMQLEVAVRGVFGVAVLETATVRWGPESFASKDEAEAAACWGTTVFAAADAFFVSEVRRDRSGGMRRYPCCFDPDMPTLRPPAPVSPACEHSPVALDQLVPAIASHRGRPDRCDFLVVSAHQSRPWEDVASLLALLGEHTVILEDAGDATCPEGPHRPPPPK